MSSLDIFAIAVLLILFVTAIAIWIALAMLPGKIAAMRSHPQSEAINVGGWLGAIFGGIFWPVFLIWAFMKPVRITTTSESENIQALRERVGALEASAGKGGGAS